MPIYTSKSNSNLSFILVLPIQPGKIFKLFTIVLTSVTFLFTEALSFNYSCLPPTPIPHIIHCIIYIDLYVYRIYISTICSLLITCFMTKMFPKTFLNIKYHSLRSRLQIDSNLFIVIGIFRWTQQYAE